MPSPFEITTPHLPATGPRRVRLIENTFMAGGVAPAGHTKCHLLVHLVRGSTILRGWEPVSVQPAGSGRVAWATVCDVEGLDLPAGDDYGLVLSRRPRPYGNFCLAATLDRFAFMGHIAPAPNPERERVKRADLRFPPNDSEHSHTAFCASGKVAPGETVPFSNCILKDAEMATQDTADDGAVTSKNVWWALFSEVSGDGIYRFEFTSSTGSTGFATGLTFKD